MYIMDNPFIKRLKIHSALTLILCLLFISCTNTVKKAETEVEDGGIREIKIKENLSNTQSINLSDIASSISYVVLETDEKCFVSPSMSIYGSKESIVTIGFQVSNHVVCYVFDRKTGSFVRQISRAGQGPGEYTELINNYWDEKNEQVCMWSHPNYIFYNLDGTISHRTPKFKYLVNSFVAYGDLYAGYSPNPIGNNTVRIAFYDQTGAVVDSIPNNRFFERTQKMIVIDNYEWLYVFHDELYFKELFCDTLYHIKDFTLCPRYIFNTGGLAVPYEIQANPMALIRDEYEQYINIIKILEDNNFLYFTVEYRNRLYPAIYDKIEDRLKIMHDVSALSQHGRDGRLPNYGFENDLDGGLPFWPTQMISEKEMMCVYTAEELLELDASKITDENLKNVLNNLEEDSNPVVAIVTLKD